MNRLQNVWKNRANVTKVRGFYTNIRLHGLLERITPMDK